MEITAINIVEQPFSVGKNNALPLGRGRLSARFRRMNILIFAVALCIIATVTILMLNGIIKTISVGYAEQYALSLSEALSERINREIYAVSKIAHSSDVIDWLGDEGDKDKTASAVEEMVDIVSDLYSYNLYVGLESSLNQYRIGIDFIEGDILLIDILDINDPADAWYFNAINSGRDYVLDIGIDREMGRKRVWVDYKVSKDNIPLGVISTGLEFSHIVGELFSQFDSSNIRGLIIDEQGTILMDSALMRDKDFLFSEFQAHIDEEFQNPELFSVVGSYLESAGLYLEEPGEPMVVNLKSGSYRNVTLMPVKATNWSVVILSGGVSLLNSSYFLPIIITVLVLLTVVALVTSAANYRLIFLPLGKLDRSLTSLRENTEGRIYGAERNDELGALSKTIQDLFTKANVDALTCIYNRRFMENNFEQSMDILSRASGLLSVLMIDIDFFKMYNDTYGHDQGDICLKEVARVISSGIMRINDFTARYGGEEFVVVLPSTDENGARVVAEKLLDMVFKLNIPHSKSTVAACVTVSIGFTTGRVTYGQNWKEYIKRADEALYLSKNNGRNQVTFLRMHNP
jgi:diguanylate cyclase (GGDEF)-like protein